jgi:hypothetical protein
LPLLGDRAHVGPCGASHGQRGGRTSYPDAEGEAHLDSGLGDAGRAQGQEPEAQIGASGLGQKKGISIMKKCIDRGGTVQYEEIRRIGEYFCENGGSPRMVRVSHRVHPLDGSLRELEFE